MGGAFATALMFDDPKFSGRNAGINDLAAGCCAAPISRSAHGPRICIATSSR